MLGLEFPSHISTYLRYQGVLFKWQAPNSIFYILQKAEQATQKEDIEQILKPTLLDELDKKCRLDPTLNSNVITTSELDPSFAFLLIDFDTKWIVWLTPGIQEPTRHYRIQNWATLNLLKNLNQLNPIGEINALLDFLNQGLNYHIEPLLNQNNWIRFFEEWEKTNQTTLHLSNQALLIFTQYDKQKLNQLIPDALKISGSQKYL